MKDEGNKGKHSSSIIFREKGKTITTIALSPDLDEFVRQQGNVSQYIRTLIERDMKEQKTEKENVAEQPKVELSAIERETFSYAMQYIGEHGSMQYDENYEFFPLQPDSELLRILLGDVLGRLKDGTNPEHPSHAIWKFIKQLREDDELWKNFYEKISQHWRQQHPIPERYMEKVIDGWTLYDILTAILPIRQNLKVSEIAGKMGITYQMAYNKIVPILRREGIKVE